jgi:hypothetical protein
MYWHTCNGQFVLIFQDRGSIKLLHITKYNLLKFEKLNKDRVVEVVWKREGEREGERVREKEKL